MFKNPLSFDGRIRRTEYGISIIIVAFSVAILQSLIKTGNFQLVGLGYIPIYWFLWAQGAKRCHDRGNNGWFQIIPLYGLWLLFGDGEDGINSYGPNPKTIGS